MSLEINLFSEKKVLLIHFLGPTSTIKEKYPEKIKFVIDNRNNSSKHFCCSTIKATDRYLSEDGEFLNAVGNVGVVLLPKNNSSIIAAGPTDIGSLKNLSDDIEPISLDNIKNSIDERDTHAKNIIHKYNEVIVKNFDVLGIFIFNPHDIFDYQNSFKYSWIEFFEHCKKFNLKFYTVIQGKNYVFSKELNLSEISIKELYLPYIK